MLALRETISADHGGNNSHVLTNKHVFEETWLRGRYVSKPATHGSSQCSVAPVVKIARKEREGGGEKEIAENSLRLKLARTSRFTTCRHVAEQREICMDGIATRCDDDGGVEVRKTSFLGALA